jgi:tetraacyldisaccharide-1-P 4'-kinase
VVLSRLAPGEDPAPRLAELRGYAPAARLAAGRHVACGVEALSPGAVPAGSRRVRVVTGTGNPQAVADTAREAGLEVVALSAYRDHHWFGAREMRRELELARRAGAAVLLTAKDAVRWGRPPHPAPVLVLRVAWEWVTGGEDVERLVLGEAR